MTGHESEPIQNPDFLKQDVAEQINLQNAHELSLLMRQPQYFMDKAEGDEADMQQLWQGIERKRSEALEMVVVPEALTLMIERSEKVVGEESLPYARSAWVLIDEIATNGPRAVGMQVDQMRDALLTAKYSVQALDDMAQNPHGQLDVDVLRRASAVMMNFADEVSEGHRRTSAIYSTQEEDIIYAGSRLGNAADIAEDERRRFVSGKAKLMEQPDLAIHDGIEDRVEDRGADSVEDHRQSCEDRVSVGIEAIADIRDDCEEIRHTLVRTAANLHGVSALSAIPRGEMILDSTDMLRRIMYQAEAGEPVHPHVIQDTVATLHDLIRRVGNGLDGLESADKEDRAILDSIAGKLNKLLVDNAELAA